MSKLVNIAGAKIAPALTRVASRGARPHYAVVSGQKPSIKHSSGTVRPFMRRLNVPAYQILLHQRATCDDLLEREQDVQRILDEVMNEHMPDVQCVRLPPLTLMYSLFLRLRLSQLDRSSPKAILVTGFLDDEALERISKLDDVVFCHRQRPVHPEATHVHAMTGENQPAPMSG